MMDAIGIETIDELFADLPLISSLPSDFKPLAESEIDRHIGEALAKNRDDLLVFCGSGCWPHYVPAVVDEIINRTEFKTAYTGKAEFEVGKWQAIFEFQSMIAELTQLDIAINSVYSEPAAAGEAMNMARRLTGRGHILVPRNIDAGKRQVCASYVEPSGGNIIDIAFDPATGLLDLDDLLDKLSGVSAAVFIDNPTYLGVLESQAEEIGALAHQAGALFIVSADPLSLGVMKAPGDYGADVAVGSGQPLGLHMNYGGNSLGYFAFRDDEKYIETFPGNICAVTTTEDGEDYAYTPTLWTRHFFVARENATSMIGSTSNLCAIGAAVYMSLLGPQGLAEVAVGIFRRTQYAMRRLGRIPGVASPILSGPHYREFTVNFDDSGRIVADINRRLSENHGIVGGKDLSADHPELGQTALFCITETHTQADIERLADAIEESLGAV